MQLDPTHPLVLRIRRAQAGIVAAERELAIARGRGDLLEIARLERDLKNRRGYLTELFGAARRPASV